MTVREYILTLEGRSFSAYHVARDLDCCHRHASVVLRKLRDEGLIYISRYEHLRYEAGVQTAFYRVGKGRNVERPSTPRTSTQKSRDYKARLLREDPDRYHVMREKERLRSAFRRGKPVQADPILSVMYAPLR